MTNDLVDQTSYDDDAAVAYDALRYDDFYNPTIRKAVIVLGRAKRLLRRRAIVIVIVDRGHLVIGH